MNENDEADLGVVCEHADAIRDRLEPVPGGAALVDAVLRAARRDQDSSAELTELRRALVSLDGRGLAVHSDDILYSGSQDLGAIGIGLPRPAFLRYGCPRRRCTRTWEPTPAEEVPLCRVSGAPLRPEG